MTLPTEATERKGIPIATGVLDYFPLALAEIAKVSLVGQQQHGLTGPLHWDKSKSTDESDALIRHFLQRYEVDTDGQLHAAKAAWRALAFLERLMEERNVKTRPTPARRCLFKEGALSPSPSNPTDVTNYRAFLEQADKLYAER